MSDLAYLVGAVVGIESEVESARCAADEARTRAAGSRSGERQPAEGELERVDREEDQAMNFQVAAYAAARDYLAARGVKDPGQALEALLCVERARAEPSER